MLKINYQNKFFISPDGSSFGFWGIGSGAGARYLDEFGAASDFGNGSRCFDNGSGFDYCFRAGFGYSFDNNNGSGKDEC